MPLGWAIPRRAYSATSFLVPAEDQPEGVAIHDTSDGMAMIIPCSTNGIHVPATTLKLIAKTLACKLLLRPIDV
jgi:hypothetical protein